MKLLNCLGCKDIVKIYEDQRACRCGKSSARYVNGRLVEYAGPARIIGLKSLDYHRGEAGVDYTWFFHASESQSIRRID